MLAVEVDLPHSLGHPQEKASVVIDTKVVLYIWGIPIWGKSKVTTLGHVA